MYSLYIFNTMVLKKFFFPSYQQYLTNVTYVPQEYLPGVKAAGA